MENGDMELDNSESNWNAESISEESILLNLLSKKKKPITQRKRFSFDEKAKMLKLLEIESMDTVCKQFNVNRRTLHDWKRKRSVIEKFTENEAFVNRKSFKKSPYEGLNEAVYIWFLQKRANGVPIIGPNLQNKALEFYEKYFQFNTDIEKFAASSGWLQRFKKTYLLTAENFS